MTNRKIILSKEGEKSYKINFKEPGSKETDFTKVCYINELHSHFVLFSRVTKINRPLSLYYNGNSHLDEMKDIFDSKSEAEEGLYQYSLNQAKEIAFWLSSEIIDETRVKESPLVSKTA